jgi:hypothetical protein
VLELLDPNCRRNPTSALETAEKDCSQRMPR